jgi:hypothetical protein
MRDSPAKKGPASVEKDKGAHLRYSFFFSSLSLGRIKKFEM